MSTDGGETFGGREWGCWPCDHRGRFNLWRPSHAPNEVSPSTAKFGTTAELGNVSVDTKRRLLALNNTTHQPH